MFFHFNFTILEEKGIILLKEEFMAQEDKDLLLKDLSTRLPYGVFVETTWTQQLTDVSGTVGTLRAGQIELFEDGDYSEIKPYLRPMLSMTEEEKKEFESLGWRVDELDDNYPWNHDAYDVFEGVDWLNKKMFDYRGLIGKGLALEAPEGMYKTVL